MQPPPGNPNTSLIRVLFGPACFWDKLRPIEQASFRLICREARDLSYACIREARVRLPLTASELDDEPVPSPAQLAAFHRKLSNISVLGVSLAYDVLPSGTVDTKLAQLALAEYFSTYSPPAAQALLKATVASLDTRIPLPSSFFIALVSALPQLQALHIVGPASNAPFTMPSILGALARCPELRALRIRYGVGHNYQSDTDLDYTGEPGEDEVLAASVSLLGLTALHLPYIITPPQLGRIIKGLPALKELGVESFSNWWDQAVTVASTTVRTLVVSSYASGVGDTFAWRPNAMLNSNRVVDAKALSLLPKLERLLGFYLSLNSRQGWQADDPLALRRTTERLAASGGAASWALALDVTIDMSEAAPDGEQWCAELAAGGLPHVQNLQLYCDWYNLPQARQHTVCERVAAALPNVRALEMWCYSEDDEADINSARLHGIIGMVRALPNLHDVYLMSYDEPEQWGEVQVYVVNMTAAAMAVAAATSRELSVHVQYLPHDVARTCNACLAAMQSPARIARAELR